MITFVCPVYNEQNYISNILNYYKRIKIQDKELYIIDGCSTDNTVKIIKEFIDEDSSIHLLINKQKYVPFALNLAINSSIGNPIIRLDAHTLYNDDYTEKILETFDKTKADIVGGPMRAIGKTPIQKAVAYSTSTKFGIGDSKIHDESYQGYTDHVYLGAWQRSLFDDIGYFDERLKRNQDDEFHYRARSEGKKIYLNPEIKSQYFPRDKITLLVKQYFQYGLYKPLVLRKIKSETKLRHLAPAFFVIYLITLPFLLTYSQLFLLPLFLYFVIDLYFTTFNKESLITKLYSAVMYPIIHLSYGTGFLVGALLQITNVFKSG